MTDAAIALLAKAKNRLVKFYNPTLYKAPAAAAPAFFAQVRAARRQLPELPTAPKYEKNSGGVLALIGKLSQDLVLDKAESGHEEKDAQTEYVELMKESNDARGESMKSATAKTSAKADLET